MRAKVASVMVGFLVISGLTFGVASPASADPYIDGGVVTCSAITPVKIQSNASGRINHREGVTTLDSWNNGGAYVWRQSNTGKASIPNWRAWVTGSGGDVYSARAYC